MEKDSEQQIHIEKKVETNEPQSATEYILSTNQQTETTQEEPVVTPPVKTEEQKDTYKKVIFVGIALLLLFLLAFAIIRLLPPIIASFSGNSGITSIFSRKEKLEASVSPQKISSGNAFELSWKHISPSTEGKYAFTYKCGQNFYIEHTYPNNKTEKVICDTPFVLPSNKNILSFTAHVIEDNGYVDVPIQVIFVKTGSNEPTLAATATLSVEDGRSESGVSIATSTRATSTIQSRPATSTSTTKPKSPTYQYNVSDYHWGQTGSSRSGSTNSGSTSSAAKADLVARNPVVGTINPTTNVFTPGAKITSGSIVGIQFEVTNSGGKSSGTWKLTAVLPTSPAQTLTSESQRSLNPGDTMIFNLRFDHLDYKEMNSVVIHIDPTNSVAESNENNNTFFITVKQEASGSTGSKPDLTIDISNYDLRNDDAKIYFKVKNNGIAFSQNWVFKVNLPNNKTYTSPSQSGMYANEIRDYTVTYENVPEDESNRISIEIDATDKIRESDEDNNDDSVTIRN